MQRFWAVWTIAVVLGMTLPAGTVSAHARPDRADPAPDSVIDWAPAEVRIWFTQELTLRGNDIVVTDAAGTRVDLGDARVDQSDPDRKQVVVTLAPLADGAYTVTWTSSSAEDGHPATESYTFSLASAAQPPPMPCGCPPPEPVAP